MSKSTIGLLGGSGFIGSVTANHLVEAGYAVRILTRSRENARGTWLLPDCDVVEVNALDQEQLDDAVAGLGAVVNFVGILNEKRDNGEGFHTAHVEITRRLVKACKDADVRHIVQISALNADSFASSYYLRSKGEAEKLLGEENGPRLTTTILRPSVVFGPHDDFVNRFAALIRVAPGVFPLASPDTRFQPVYVGDLAEAIVRVIGDRSAAGQRYDIGGPEVMSLAEIVAYIARLLGRPLKIIPLGASLSALQANILEFVPGKPFSRDNLRSMKEDSVCQQNDGLVELGIEPTPMRAIVPGYLGGGDMRHRYYDYRAEARRD